MKKLKRRKNKKTLLLTNNNKEYKKALRELEGSGCPICPINRGCNRNRKHDRSWKNFRKTQWKE